ncbi:MAG: hypothetical protein ACE5GC_07370 [Acidimicrobiia bacterium]
MIFVVLLMAASVTVSVASDAALRPVRMTGAAVKRWGGVVLVAVGGWFILLAGLPTPVLGA